MSQNPARRIHRMHKNRDQRGHEAMQDLARRLNDIQEKGEQMVIDKLAKDVGPAFTVYDGENVIGIASAPPRAYVVKRWRHPRELRTVYHLPASHGVEQSIVVETEVFDEERSVRWVTKTEWHAKDQETGDIEVTPLWRHTTGVVLM